MSKLISIAAGMALMLFAHALTVDEIIKLKQAPA